MAPPRSASESSTSQTAEPRPTGSSVIVPWSELPTELDLPEAVEAAYPEPLAHTADSLRRGLPVLIEADKELVPFLYMAIRNRLRAHNLRCLYLDGREQATPPDNQPGRNAAGGPSPSASHTGGFNQGVLGTMLQQLRDAVRGAMEARVLVLPHLDLLTTSAGGLTGEAREAVTLLYENPNLVALGFKDPSFPLPKVIENVFPRRIHLLGLPRDRLRHLVTLREARKFGREFNPWTLYKHVSGMNAVRLRRLLSTLDGPDYPESPRKVLAQIRQATVGSSLEIPEVDLYNDIGGYDKVKQRIQREILDPLARRDQLDDPDAIKRLEGLIPKGIILHGPPGTGKTLFAKAIATALGAAVTIVSGPELKSKWVGESEENLRRVFRQARESAPAVIVFDELDSFAVRRGSYEGSGVEHSMVNQLLTEMDGFHAEELVFVVGTTNFAESLDPALLRPGRFEYHLHIPYPSAEDRRAIWKVHDRAMNLRMTDAALEAAVRITGDLVPGVDPPSRYSGDHIQALGRALARRRLRLGTSPDTPTTPEDLEAVLLEWVERPELTPEEEKVVAVHECGHAVVSLFCPHAPAIERISIRGDLAGSLGHVKHLDHAHKHIITRGRLLDDICVLMGGREAERLTLEDLSIGSSEDLRRATAIARALVEEFGMDDSAGVRRFMADDQPRRIPDLSEADRQRLDQAVSTILESQRIRAAAILTEHRLLVDTLRDLLLERKVLSARDLAQLVPDKPSVLARVASPT